MSKQRFEYRVRAGQPAGVFFMDSGGDATGSSFPLELTPSYCVDVDRFYVQTTGTCYAMSVINAMMVSPFFSQKIRRQRDMALGGGCLSLGPVLRKMKRRLAGSRVDDDDDDEIVDPNAGNPAVTLSPVSLQRAGVS